MSKQANVPSNFIVSCMERGDRVSPYVYPGLEEMTGKVVMVQFVNDLCHDRNLNLQDVLGRTRRREYVETRQVAMYILREYEKKTFHDIGRLFDRDHATVIHAWKKFKSLMSVGDKEAEEIYSSAKRIYLYQKIHNYGEQKNL